MRRSGADTEPSLVAFDHQFLEFGDGSGGIEALRTVDCAIHDGVTTIQAEWILKCVESFTGGLITAIDDPAVGLQQDRGPKKPFTVPPIARTGG